MIEPMEDFKGIRIKYHLNGAVGVIEICLDYAVDNLVMKTTWSFQGTFINDQWFFIHGFPLVFILAETPK
ncbi:MAG TPA: hypothetical protein DHV51_02835 [Opitutae bacterium]|nr:hypothetical protein [Opitutae bacterium]